MRDAAASAKEAVRTLTALLTTECNLRCRYCYQRRRGRRMSWPTLRAAVDWLFAAPADRLRLGFSGGEPLLEFASLRRAVARAERRRSPGQPIEYGLVTNGLLLDGATAEFLERHRFRVQLSFDGVPRAQDLRARGSFAALDALLVRLRRDCPGLFEHGLRVAITVPPRAVPYLADSVAYFLGRRVRQLQIAPAMGVAGGGTANAARQLQRAFERVERLCWDHYQATGAAPLLLFGRSLWAGQPRGEAATRSRAARQRPLPMCRVGRLSQLTVDADGALAECPLLADSATHRPAGRARAPIPADLLGTILEPTLAGGAPAYRAALAATGLFGDRRAKSSRFGRCADCRHLADCEVCPMAIALDPGGHDPDRIPDFQCAFYRAALEHAERFCRRATRAAPPGGGPFIPLAMRRLAGALGSVRA